jgi:hypothetical protein
MPWLGEPFGSKRGTFSRFSAKIAETFWPFVKGPVFFRFGGTKIFLNI